MNDIFNPRLFRSIAFDMQMLHVYSTVLNKTSGWIWVGRYLLIYGPPKPLPRLPVFDCFKHLMSADRITLWVFGPPGILLHAEVSGSASPAVEALIGWFIHQGWQRPTLGFSGATDSPKCFSGAILNRLVGTEEGRNRAKRQKTDVAATSATDWFNAGLNRTQCGEKNNL